MSKSRVLFYDIETTPLQAWVWGCGKQVVRHGQLVSSHNKYDIICITYCWNDGKPAKSLDWGYNEQNSKDMIEQFDILVHNADVTIGKNSDRFDVKHINTQRLLANLPGHPEWAAHTDDLEKQMRKHFYLPSYSLDYFSELLGFGGKIKMEFQDWINIVCRTPGKGRAAFKKMIEYGKKDVEDTRAIWNHCLKHFTPKFRHSNYDFVCPYCGSSELIKNGTRCIRRCKYQRFYCNEHGGYAGKCVIKKNGTYGAIQ